MKERRRKPWFIGHKMLSLLLVLVGFALVSSIFTTPDDPKQSESKQAAGKEQALKKIGDAVRDGKFEFTVNKLNCGEKTVGNEYLSVNAQGQFCRISITVKNISGLSHNLNHSDQYAYNNQNQKYSANSEAAVYASSGAPSAWSTDINPGNIVTGDMFFDIPESETLVLLELHDSALSEGVKIDLKNN